MPISDWKQLDPETAYVAMSGQLSREDYREACEVIAGLARETSMIRVAIDKCRVSEGLDSKEAQAVANETAEAMAGAGLERVAFILAHDDPVAGPFAESFTRLGGQAGAFDDLEPALSWLETGSAQDGEEGGRVGAFGTG